MNRQQLNDFIDSQLKEARALLRADRIYSQLGITAANEKSETAKQAIKIASEILRKTGLEGDPLVTRMGLDTLFQSAYGTGWRMADNFLKDVEKLCREKGYYFEHTRLDGAKRDLPPPAENWKYTFE